jgi:hypothetical protein
VPCISPVLLDAVTDAGLAAGRLSPTESIGLLWACRPVPIRAMHLRTGVQLQGPSLRLDAPLFCAWSTTCGGSTAPPARCPIVGRSRDKAAGCPVWPLPRKQPKTSTPQ